MSFVLDQVKQIDAQLDRVQLSNLPSLDLDLTTQTSTFSSTPQNHIRPSARILALQAAIRTLSPASSGSRSLPSSRQIQTLLSLLSDNPSATLSTQTPPSPTPQKGDGNEAAEQDPYELELSWLLTSKATTLIYGHALSALLTSTLNLADEIGYWDDVLSSRRWTLVYSAQISPLRAWEWGNQIWSDAKARAGNFDVSEVGQDASRQVRQSWGEFYALVRQVIRERSGRELQMQMLSPVTRIQNSLREKKKRLQQVRLRNANALGVLIGEGMANDSAHGKGLATPSSGGSEDGQHQEQWKVSVARNVALMEAVLVKANDLDTEVEKFDTAIAELTEDDEFYGVNIADGQDDIVSIPPQIVAERLARVINLALPQYISSSRFLTREHGKPSRLTRYWIPLTLGVLSSSTVLRVLLNRRAEITQWIEDLGSTILDFWRNWVVEPTRKVIQTIRHDEGSEVSIMSKRSLEGDRESLERMVVEFAIDNPHHANGSSAPLTSAEIAGIRAQVREGDLTPVLKAYEKDLASPFMGTVRGNLIRALLIQIQKTKVDVEVAMGGIDALLKSQELVFGFVGLTPGILVTYFVARSLRSSLTEKRGSRAAIKQGKMLRLLRNIDRILTDATPTEFGELPYRDLGLLVCEVHALRSEAERCMPGVVLKEFAVEAEELCDVRVGAEKQRKIAERIRWGYGRWLS